MTKRLFLALALVLLWAGAGWGTNDSLGLPGFGTTGRIVNQNVVHTYWDISGSPSTVAAHNGTADSIRAWMHWKNTGIFARNFRMRMCLYAGNPTVADPWLVDSTKTDTLFTIPASFDGDTAVVMHLLHDSAVYTSIYAYLPAVWSGAVHSSCTTYVTYNSTSGDTMIALNRTYTGSLQNWPDPLSGGITASRELGIQLFYHYTPTAGIKPRRRRILLEGVGWQKWKDAPQHWLWPHCQGVLAVVSDEISQ